MGFNQIRDLARRGYLPKIVANAQQVKCSACRQGKAVKQRSDKKNKIAKDNIVQNLTDFVHMGSHQLQTDHSHIVVRTIKIKYSVCPYL